jgi:hypothetical protein
VNKHQLPAGWRISQYSVYDGPDVDFWYKAQRWGTETYTVKRFLRKSVQVKRTGWHDAGFESRHSDVAAQWINDTVRAMEAAK